MGFSGHRLVAETRVSGQVCAGLYEVMQGPAISHTDMDAREEGGRTGGRLGQQHTDGPLEVLWETPHYPHVKELLQHTLRQRGVTVLRQGI